MMSKVLTAVAVAGFATSAFGTPAVRVRPGSGVGVQQPTTSTSQFQQMLNQMGSTKVGQATVVVNGPLGAVANSFAASVMAKNAANDNSVKEFAGAMVELAEVVEPKAANAEDAITLANAATIAAEKSDTEGGKIAMKGLAQIFKNIRARRLANQRVSVNDAVRAELREGNAINRSAVGITASTPDTELAATAAKGIAQSCELGG
jgi:hypothetical protein